jgi:hypothetical protein
MTNGGTRLGCIAGAIALWAAATALAAESGESPYQSIVVRNVFGLKDPPPPQRPEDNKPPPPKIMLQGITTILGKKRALMKVMTPPKPGAKPEDQSFILTEGQRDGDIEVLEIDEKAGIVKVNNSGTITNLNFADNGVKLASGPAPGMPGPGPGMPGGPPNPGAGVPPPGFNPAAVPGGYQPRSIPMNRASRMNPAGASTYSPGYGGSSAPTPTVYSAVPTTQAPGTTAGTMALGGLGAPASTPKPAQNWPPEVNMTPEQAAIMEAAYALKYQKQISDGTMPSIPGAERNPLLNNGNTSGQTKTKSNF